MTWLFVSFAGVALLLAAVGAYGVVSFSTAQRTFEIGVRWRSEPRRPNIFGLVLGQSLRLAMAGLALGPAVFTRAHPPAGDISLWHATTIR